MLSFGRECDRCSIGKYGSSSDTVCIIPTVFYGSCIESTQCIRSGKCYVDICSSPRCGSIIGRNDRIGFIETKLTIPCSLYSSIIFTTKVKGIISLYGKGSSVAICIVSSGPTVCIIDSPPRKIESASSTICSVPVVLISTFFQVADALVAETFGGVESQNSHVIFTPGDQPTTFACMT